jgi:c-di-AMP phosphodiesterase-like protein
MKSYGASKLMHSLSIFLHRFHITIFVLFVVGGLSAVTFLLNLVISTPASNTDQAAQQTFDTTTIDELKSRSENAAADSITLPPGRTNPFQ